MILSSLCIYILLVYSSVSKTNEMMGVRKAGNRIRARCEICKTTRLKHPELKFFRFPKDPERCHQWAEMCVDSSLVTLPSSVLYSKHRICSRHFDRGSFKTNKFHRLHSYAVPFRSISDEGKPEGEEEDPFPRRFSKDELKELLQEQRRNSIHGPEVSSCILTKPCIANIKKLIASKLAAHKDEGEPDNSDVMTESEQHFSSIKQDIESNMEFIGDEANHEHPVTSNANSHSEAECSDHSSKDSDQSPPHVHTTSSESEENDRFLQQEQTKAEIPFQLFSAPDPTIIYISSNSMEKNMKQTFCEPTFHEISKPVPIKSEKKDQFYYFGNNIVHQLRQLPLQNAMECQTKILKLLAQEKTKCLRMQ